MRFNVSHLVKAPIGTRDEVRLNTGTITLADDLVLHYLRGDISLTRSTDGLLAEGQLETALDSECARCLVSFSLPLTMQLDDLIFALPHASRSNYQYHITGDGWIHADLALREQILLSVPLRPLCHPDCRGLCNQCGQDLGSGTCNCEKQTGDPRLAVLRDLL